MTAIVSLGTSVASALASRVASFDWSGWRVAKAHVEALITPTSVVPDCMEF